MFFSSLTWNHKTCKRIHSPPKIKWAWSYNSSCSSSLQFNWCSFSLAHHRLCPFRFVAPFAFFISFLVSIFRNHCSSNAHILARFIQKTLLPYHYFLVFSSFNRFDREKRVACSLSSFSHSFWTFFFVVSP